MTNNIYQFPNLKGRANTFEPLFQSLWDHIGVAAIEARDKGRAAQADVGLAAILAMTKAIAIMARGDRAVAQAMLKATHEALDPALDDALDEAALIDKMWDELQ